MSSKTPEFARVRIEKLVHGGQGLGELPDGRKVFVWNALPGERLSVRLLKTKKSYAEAITEELLIASEQRIPALEPDYYLSTSPWQIMNFDFENESKKSIVIELFAHQHVTLPDISAIVHDERQWHYRNKMEYSFWGNEDGLHLALHQRGSHQKLLVSGSQLALPAVDEAATTVAELLDSNNIRAGDLKTVIVRSSQAGACVAALFVRSESFPELSLPDCLQSLTVYYSDPRSPASVPTKLLQSIGDPHISDTILSRQFQYDVNSFFQVNPPVFELALSRIQDFLHSSGQLVELVDMYSGVGTIGLSLQARSVDLIELDPASAAMARINVDQSGVNAQVYEVSSEKALEYISSSPVVVDPPRAGLHPKLTARLLEAQPEQIVYLSCNPATQARDLELLQSAYVIEDFSIYNFFPRTPHIETLALLRRRKVVDKS